MKKRMAALTAAAACVCLMGTAYGVHGAAAIRQEPEDLSELNGLYSESELTEYSPAELLPVLEKIGAGMKQVVPDPSEEYLQMGFESGHDPGMIRGFSVYDPSSPESEAREVLTELSLSADQLLSDIYDFQRGSLKKYTDLGPMDVSLVNAYMDPVWVTCNGIRAYAGKTMEEDTALFWIPFYYEDTENPFLGDRLYLYVVEVESGTDSDFLEKMGVYDPEPGVFRLTQYILSDPDNVAAFLKVPEDGQKQQREAVVGTAYTLLEQGSQGEAVRVVQNRLSELYILKGQVDGVYGPMTAEAVKRYQEMKELESTGKADEETQRMLLSEEIERFFLTDWLSRHS